MAKHYKYLSLFLVTSLSLILALDFGSSSVDLGDTLNCLLAECSTTQRTILFDIRLPRILMGFVAGASLAMAGAILQNTTRNPLADPYLFGIVSGAGLGATIASLVLPGTLDIALPVAAFIGSVFSVLIILLLARWITQLTSLILAGVAISFMLSSVTQLLLYLGEPFATNRVIFWLMGSLARAEFQQLWVIFPISLISMALILLYSRQADALLTGDESAQTLGVNVQRVRLFMLLICAALTAVVVAYCGGIGFVGLMIPHIVRQWVGVTTRSLVIGSALLGGCFLVWIDVLARIAIDGQELPIGVITSAIGSIFFLMVMSQRKGQFNG